MPLRDQALRPRRGDRSASDWAFNVGHLLFPQSDEVFEFGQAFADAAPSADDVGGLRRLGVAAGRAGKRERRIEFPDQGVDDATTLGVGRGCGVGGQVQGGVFGE